MCKKAWLLAIGTTILLSGCSLVGTGNTGYQKPNGSTITTQQYAYDSATSLYHFYTNDSSKLSGSGSTYWTQSNQVSAWNGSTSYDFSAEVTKTSGQASAGYGIVFAATDIQNFLCVLITKDGDMQVGQVVDRVYTVLSDWGTGWAKVGNLTTGYGQKNTLLVHYEAGTPKPFSVYVNGSGTAALNFAAATYNAGNKAGFITVLSSAETFPSVPVDTSFKVVTPGSLVIN